MKLSLPSRRNLALLGCLFLFTPGCRSRDTGHADAPVTNTSHTDTSSFRLEPPVIAKENPYYERRQVVHVALILDEQGGVREAEVVRNFASGAEADSVREALRTRPWPEEIRRVFRETPLVVPVVMDRTEARQGPEQSPGLDERARELLRTEPLVRWVDALRGLDSGFGLDDFRLVYEEPGHLDRYEDALSDSAMQNKIAHGLLIPSPDNRFYLDTMAGMYVSRDGFVGCDVDVGYAVFDVASGDRLMYQVSPYMGIDLGAWTDATTFVLVGQSWVMGLDVKLEFPIPAVWVGNAERGSVRIYAGVPLLPDLRRMFHRMMDAERAAAHPDLRW